MSGSKKLEGVKSAGQLHFGRMTPVEPIASSTWVKRVVIIKLKNMKIEEFTDQYFEATNGKNDIRREDIKNAIKNIYESLMEEIAMLKKDKDTIYQWFDSNAKEPFDEGIVDNHIIAPASSDKFEVSLTYNRALSDANAKIYEKRLYLDKECGK